MIIQKLGKFVTNSSYRTQILSNMGYYNKSSDREHIEKLFKAKMGYDLDLEDPKTYNEKLQWLKLYDRNPLYTVMVDKYRVRDYIKEKIGEEYLIPLLGVWDDPDDIDFNSLPDKFVLKCNHNSGLGMYICRDKKTLNIPSVISNLKKGMAEDYFFVGREWPYKDVPRKIVCEQFMQDKVTSDLRDYKFYCFNGKAKLLGIYANRNNACETTADYFDRDYNWTDIAWGYSHAAKHPEKPEMYDEMIAIADKLSEGIPELRVDLYLCNGKIYFGELTFFDGSGFDEITPHKWDELMGSWIQLPNKK